MHIFATENGTFYKRTPGSATFTSVTLPATVTVRSPVKRPWAFVYSGAIHAGGLWNKNIVYYRVEDRLRKDGITAPSTAPTVTNSGSGLTGSYICSYSFCEKNDAGAILQESSLSPETAALNLVDGGRAWSNIAASGDARVTHVRLYCRVNGSIPHNVVDITIGTTSKSETTADATILTNDPGPLDIYGELDEVGRGIPPAATFGCCWDFSGWYIDGSTRGVYHSMRYEPGSVSSDTDLSVVYIPSGEMPLSMCARGDELCVFTRGGLYSITSYDGEYAIQRVAGSPGIIAPFSAANVRGTVMWAGPEGIMAYDGSSVRNLMARSYRGDWMADYASNTLAYQDGIGTDDGFGTYLFLVSLATEPKSLYWVGYYRPMLEEGAPEPWWYLWKRNRLDYALGVLNDSGKLRPYRAYGSSDGHVRKDLASDNSDDSDTYLKHLRIRHPHLYNMDQAGDQAHGSTPTDLDLYLRNENVAVTVTGWSGDQDAPSGDAVFTETIAAAASSTAGWTDRGSVHLTVDGMTGKGHTIQLDVDSPDSDFEYLGMELWAREGSHGQPAT